MFCFVYMLGIKIGVLLMWSFSRWLVCVVVDFTALLRYWSKTPATVVLLLSFDLFILLLRPVTLTLRVVINVILGHTVFELVSDFLLAPVWLLMSLEVFVYIVQSFVFLMLINSYKSTV